MLGGQEVFCWVSGSLVPTPFESREHTPDCPVVKRSRGPVSEGWVGNASGDVKLT